MLAEDTKINENSEPNARAVIHLTARLAQVLAQEADSMKAMKLKDVEKLQQEKLFLTAALEAQKKRLRNTPRFSETIPSQDRKDLEDVINVFNGVLQENARQLELAKRVNETIVTAITSTVRDAARSSVYNHRGVPGGMLRADNLSITLNKTI